MPPKAQQTAKRVVKKVWAETDPLPPPDPARSETMDSEDELARWADPSRPAPRAPRAGETRPGPPRSRPPPPPRAPTTPPRYTFAEKPPRYEVELPRPGYAETKEAPLPGFGFTLSQLNSSVTSVSCGTSPSPAGGAAPEGPVLATAICRSASMSSVGRNGSSVITSALLFLTFFFFFLF